MVYVFSRGELILISCWYENQVRPLLVYDTHCVTDIWSGGTSILLPSMYENEVRNVNNLPGEWVTYSI